MMEELRKHTIISEHVPLNLHTNWERKRWILSMPRLCVAVNAVKQKIMYSSSRKNKECIVVSVVLFCCRGYLLHGRNQDLFT
jgi:hypothetical protein